MRFPLLVLSLLLLAVLSFSVISPFATGTAIADDNRSNAITQSNAPMAQSAPINQISFQTLKKPHKEVLTRQTVDVGAAIQIGHQDATNRLERYALLERFNHSPGQRGVVESALNDLRDDIRNERETARADRQRYLNGSITVDQFVRGVLYRHAAHKRHEARLDLLSSVVGDLDSPVLQILVNRLERELLGRDGPVQSQALGALRGTANDLHLYLAVSENGSVFAMQDGTTYLRTAYRSDLREYETATFELAAAASRAEELYPVAFDPEFNIGYAIRGRGGGSYLIESDLQFGGIESFLDGNTRNVFSELQRRELSEIVQPKIAESRDNQTRLLVNRTYAGGPLRIATFDNDTGEPVKSKVEVGNRRLNTGSDGVVWTLAPPGPSIHVRAIRDAGTVSMSVRSIEIRPINSTESGS